MSSKRGIQINVEAKREETVLLWWRATDAEIRELFSSRPQTVFVSKTSLTARLLGVAPCPCIHFHSYL